MAYRELSQDVQFRLRRIALADRHSSDGKIEKIVCLSPVAETPNEENFCNLKLLIVRALAQRSSPNSTTLRHHHG